MIVTISVLVIALLIGYIALCASVMTTRLASINLALATSSAVQLAYLKHSEDEAMVMEATAIQIMVNALSGVQAKIEPGVEGEVERS